MEPTEDEISKGAKVMEIKEEGEETKKEGGIMIIISFMNQKQKEFQTSGSSH